MPTRHIRLICAAVISFASLSPAAAQELVADYGEPGVDEGELRRASGMDVDGAGNVFIADRQRNRILRFNTEGAFVGELPFFFAGPNLTFDQVNDVAIAPNQRLYVANEDNGQIVVLDFDFNIVDTFGSQCFGPGVAGEGCVDPDGDGPLETGDGQFNDVAAVAYGPNDRIVAADTGNDRIEVFDLDGNFILKFGNQGDDVGEFQGPSDVDADKDGNIYVADTGNDRVQVFDAAGNFVRAFGSNCDIETSDGCVDPDGACPPEPATASSYRR